MKSETSAHLSDHGKPVVRIGAVSYLNTKPLVYGLDQLLPEAEIVYDLPSRLADQLSTGQLDVALIPSIEYLLNPDYTIISDACIACRGPVYSVQLISRKPIEEIKTLALDEGSRTSVAMVQILLSQRFNRIPQLEPFPIGSHISELSSDAVLVIGDRAMHLSNDDFCEVWDLGEEWCRWSTLPFVFAMWVARASFSEHFTRVQSALSTARDQGVKQLAEIARQESAHVQLSQSQCHDYLQNNLHFYLGPEEQQGLELFFDHAQKLELLPGHTF